MITKRNLVLFLVMAVALMSLAGCFWGDGIEYSDGGITDSGFEGEALGLWRSEATDGSVTLDDADSYKGKQSLKIGAEGAYVATVSQYIKGLRPGYYYVEAYAKNAGDQDFCYIYGNGSNQGRCTTAVPKCNEWTRVVARGIEVSEDGILEIGIATYGYGQLASFDNFSIHYEEDQDKQYESLFGGAISWLDWVEDKGGKYYREDKTEADALQIMAESGCNFVRLELYNNPGQYSNELGETFPEGYKDADAIFDLAKRADAKGMKIQLSFMYSDYWGNEAIPADWLEAIDGKGAEEKVEILTELLYQYTKSYMQRLAAEGIYPEYVSLGNEMEGGILLPYGCTYSDEAALEAFCSFMDAGYRAVKEVSPSSQIVLHISCNAGDLFWKSKEGMGRWFFDICEENGIKYDVIGTSFYPFWAQTTDSGAAKKALNAKDFTEWCNIMIKEYDKDILVMETGYNWGKPGQLSNNGAYTGIYASTPQGQRDFMLEMINAIKCVDGGRCVGDLYWDPVLVRQSGIGYAIDDKTGEAKPNVVETTTFFNYNHVALPVLDVYRYNTVGTDEAAIYGKVTDKSGRAVANTALTVSFNGTSYTVITDRYGDYYLNISAGSGKISLDGVQNGKISLKPGDKLRLDLKA